MALLVLRSHCWVYAAGLDDGSISEKYSWSILKALSSTVTAGLSSPKTPWILVENSSLLWGPGPFWGAGDPCCGAQERCVGGARSLVVGPGTLVGGPQEPLELALGAGGGGDLLLCDQIACHIFSLVITSC